MASYSWIAQKALPYLDMFPEIITDFRMINLQSGRILLSVKLEKFKLKQLLAWIKLVKYWFYLFIKLNASFLANKTIYPQFTGRLNLNIESYIGKIFFLTSCINRLILLWINFRPGSKAIKNYISRPNCITFLNFLYTKALTSNFEWNN